MREMPKASFNIVEPRKDQRLEKTLRTTKNTMRGRGPGRNDVTN